MSRRDVDTSALENGEGRRTRFLLDFAAVVSTSLTRSLLTERLVQTSIAAFADVCAIHVLEQQQMTLCAVADRRDPAADRAQRAFGLALAVRDGFIHEAIRSAQPLLYLRTAGRGALVDENATRLLHATGMRSLIVVPLMAGSSAIGTVCFLEGDLPDPYSSADIECALAAGRQLSIMLQNIALRDQERRTTERFRFLAHATDQLFAATESAQMLQQLLNVIVEYFGDWAIAARFSENALDVVASAEAEGESGVSLLREGRMFSETAESALLAAVRSERPLVVNEISKSPAPGRGPREEEMPTRAWMMAPLFVGGRHYGAVICYSSARRYEEADLEMLQELCRRASLALDHSESFARERRLTQTLQQATMPTNLASVEGAILSVVYIPAA
ncbi:MAG: GAF domain-containing protein, partial [Candidatus Eremiobacteraeota bacterium]|nr:GAF domain-containing protein [Candidatus Eremiobacteraeota bacterium]